MSTVSFIVQLDPGTFYVENVFLWHDLNGFKSRFVRNPIALGSFEIASLYPLCLFLLFLPLSCSACSALYDVNINKKKQHKKRNAKRFVYGKAMEHLK